MHTFCAICWEAGKPGRSGWSADLLRTRKNVVFLHHGEANAHLSLSQRWSFLFRASQIPWLKFACQDLPPAIPDSITGRASFGFGAAESLHPRPRFGGHFGCCSGNCRHCLAVTKNRSSPFSSVMHSKHTPVPSQEQTSARVQLHHPKVFFILL